MTYYFQQPDSAIGLVNCLWFMLKMWGCMCLVHCENLNPKGWALQGFMHDSIVAQEMVIWIMSQFTPSGSPCPLKRVLFHLVIWAFAGNYWSRNDGNVTPALPNIIPFLQAVVQRAKVEKNCRFHKSKTRQSHHCRTIVHNFFTLSFLTSLASCNTRRGREYNLHHGSCKVAHT